MTPVEVKVLVVAAIFVVYLAGIGSDALVTKIAAWCVVTAQRRRDRRAAGEKRWLYWPIRFAWARHDRRLLSWFTWHGWQTMNERYGWTFHIGRLLVYFGKEAELTVTPTPSAAALIEPPGGPVYRAMTPLQSKPFVIEVSPFQDQQQTVMLLRRLMCELRAEDRRRYFPGDPTGGVN